MLKKQIILVHLVLYWYKKKKDQFQRIPRLVTSKRVHLAKQLH